MKLKKTKPHYRGYVRSGAILFNNINQHNTKDVRTPKAVGKTRNEKQ